MNRFILFLYVVFTFCFIGRNAFAGVEVGASCYMDMANGEIKGTNLDERMPMASVSKLLTTEWAVAVRGFDYRFPTKIDIYKTDVKDVYDVHLRGSMDPFFDREQMHFMISELNKINVKKIRTLSFDANFKYTWDAVGGPRTASDPSRVSHITAIELPFYAPTPDVIIQNMRLKTPFLQSYARSQARAKKLGIELIENPEMEIQDFKYIPSTRMCSMKPKDPDISRVLFSAPLKTLLREMNRTSNNYAASMIFDSLGGARAYKRYLKTKFNFDEKQVKMANGSGSPLYTDLDLNPIPKYYNEATCRSVLTILKKLADRAKVEESGLASVMVVAGLDRDSTLRFYSTPTLSNSMVGKTGTVNSNIALGGMALTGNGKYLFYENMNTNCMSGCASGTLRARWNQSRRMVRDRVTSFIQQNGGPHRETFNVGRFFTYGPEFNYATHSCDFSESRYTPEDPDLVRARTPKQDQEIVVKAKDPNNPTEFYEVQQSILRQRGTVKIPLKKPEPEQPVGPVGTTEEQKSVFRKLFLKQ